GLDHADLAAAPFFGGRAEKLDRALDPIFDRRKREKRTERASRDEVVPARVAEVGQRVVLGEDGDLRTAARADARAERRIESGESLLDGDSGQARGFDKPAAGAM